MPIEIIMDKPFYNNEDKIVVKNYCIAFISGNGYIRVGYAVDNAITGKRFEGKGHRDAFINSVSAMLVNTGKYVREKNEQVPGDYDILLNPNYYINESIVNTNNVTRFIAVVAVVVSILGLAKDIWKSDKVDVPQLEKLNKQFERQSKLIDSLVHQLENINYSLQNITYDTLEKKHLQ